jgi:hypothetical protein
MGWRGVGGSGDDCAGRMRCDTTDCAACDSDICSHPDQAHERAHYTSGDMDARGDTLATGIP